LTQEELAAAGFPLEAAAHARLTRYVELLLEENRRLNLVSARSIESIWPLHVCDSLSLQPLIDAARSASLADLGSGAGLPGAVVACARPGVVVTLIDATRKKTAAVQRICRAAGLVNVEVRWGRAEELAHDRRLRERFDAVTARAVGALPVLGEWAAGYVRPGGFGWFFKSLHAAEAEIAEAAAAAECCGWRFLEARAYELPPPHGRRCHVVYARTAPLPRGLPRPTAQIARGPLPG
jgi:16S rRNA (guanine527-N7)-methyltransferase